MPARAQGANFAPNSCYNHPKPLEEQHVARSGIFEIKGIGDGLLVTVKSGAEWQAVHTALRNHFSERAAFFKGARVALDLGTMPLSAKELDALRADLEPLGIELWAVEAESPKTVKAARALGLATRVPRPEPTKTKPRRAAQPLGEEAILVRGTLRSGMRVEFAGHVVVLGNVHAGAEVVAGGNIIVWGRLRGLAHAGAWGNREAVVCALELSPTQLRIADVIAASPAEQAAPQPEIASLKGNQVVAEPWDASP